jgi:TonB-linked SusC/RagA family outer membrane protein
MKQIFIVLLLLCLADVLAAQQTVTGKVTDDENGEPLIGASVIEKGTNNGVLTDVNGDYKLTLTKSETIILVSYAGVQTEVMVSNAETVYNVRLSNRINLNEMVVTALGLRRESKDLGYAIQQLDGKNIDAVKSPNFLDNLSGKLAGVTISQGATGVGSTSKIIIRGESSFTNNNPLFVVDGSPINNNTILNITNEKAAGFQGVDFGNGAMEINPDDIESISVLKGQSAAALYGTRASNGVIIINTKNGSGTDGVKVSFNSTIYLEKPFQLPQFQNTYGQGNGGQFQYVNGLGGGINDNITYSYGPKLDVGLNIPQYDSPVTLPDGTVVRGGDIAVHGGATISATPFVSNPNNLKDFYNTGTTAINNLSLAGGFDKGYYRLSLTDLNSTSILPGVNLKRKTAAARLTFEPFQNLKVTANANYINSNSDNRPASTYGSENINYSLVAWLGRQTNLNPLKDYWQPGLEGVQQYSYNYTFFDNPYFILLENRNSFNRDRLFGNLSAVYDFNSHLSLSIRSGMDYSNEQRKFRRAYSSNRFKNGAYAEQNVFSREINTDFLLNYRERFNSLFSLDLSFGGNRLDVEAATNQTQALSLAQPGVFKLSNAASPLEIFEFESRKRINSLYGMAKLAYSNFLYLDITGRNDWSSALATPTSTANTSFFYPSVSLSFVVSNVVDLPQVISFAKIRASWAQVGNDTEPFQTVGVFQSYTAFSSLPTFTDQNRIANANLLPEQTTSTEFGVDVRFWDDRLTLDATYYNALTENQILSLPIALSSGYNEQVRNGGAVRSKGVELMLGANPIRKENFNWNAQLNFSRNITTVEDLPDEVDRITLAYSRIYDNPNQTVWFQVREGDRIGDMWGTGYLKNEDGQFIVGADGRLIVDNTLKKLGNYNPDFILGFSNQLEYKNLSLNILMDWRQGGVLVSRTLSLAAVGGQLIETENRPEEGLVFDGVVNTGTTDNPIYVPNTTAISAESYYRQFYDRNHEENNLYDASYLKIREVAFTYRFAEEMLSDSFLKNVSKLSISVVGRNLYAFSAIPHFDPEQLALQGNNFVSGVEDMSYPTTKSFGIKLGVEF